MKKENLIELSINFKLSILKKIIFILFFFVFFSCEKNDKINYPNIILVMTDDQGWGQTGYYKHPILKTPNLDLMAKNGLRAWVKDNWVDIANKKSDGSYPKCGRSGKEKRKNYPKCVPIAKARAMSASQRASAVSRKKKAERKTRKNKRPNYART